MMSNFGKVNNIYFHKKPNSKDVPDINYPLFNPEENPVGYKVAYVVFSDAEAVKEAMTISDDFTLVASTENNPIKVGIEKWYNEYNQKFIPEPKLSKEIERIMNDYDERIANGKQNNDPDEDGWVTVSSKKSSTGKIKAKKDSRNPKGRRRKNKMAVLQNFYAFQKNETNMKHLEDKRKKFEEDARRMTLLRSARKFKPL